MPLPFDSLTRSPGSNSPRPVQNISSDVANAPRTEPLDFVDGRAVQDPTVSRDVDHISQQVSELQGELLVSLKEDISEWITKTLGDEIQIDAENFVYALDNGVILCQLSLAIERKAKEAIKQGIINETLPDYRLHCNRTAKSGTWFARDNTANFLGWCRAYGMIDETLFDSEDLVAHHQERQVIYCLMELARLGARFGMEPPTLITMEKEIDTQLTPRGPVTPPPKPMDPPISRKSPTPTPSPVPPEMDEEEEEEQFPPLSPPRSRKASTSSSISTLDSEVKRVSCRCKCQEYVNKLSEGVYNVFGKRVFIRLLKGKHLMVRVGGGWDTFENYLLHHDPIQVFEFHQGGGVGGGAVQSGPVQSHSFAAARQGFKPVEIQTPKQYRFDSPTGDKSLVLVEESDVAEQCHFQPPFSHRGDVRFKMFWFQDESEDQDGECVGSSTGQTWSASKLRSRSLSAGRSGSFRL